MREWRVSMGSCQGRVEATLHQPRRRELSTPSCFEGPSTYVPVPKLT